MEEPPQSSVSESHERVEEDIGEPPTKKAKYAEEGEQKLNVFTSGCTVCRKTDGKYRCPGCGVVTCSLACTKQHRVDSRCKGTRDRSAFVSLSQFNESHLLSDISLLNDFARVNDISHRRSAEVEVERLPKRFKILESKSKQIGLKLHFLPAIMSKHRDNSTRFDNKTQRIFWHTELVFDLLAEGKTTTVSGLDDSLLPMDAIQHLLEQPQQKDLKDRVNCTYPADKTQWRAYILQPMCPNNKPLFHPMNPTETIRTALLRGDILEYPTIHITKSDSEDKYELYTEELFAERSKAHLDQIESFTREEASQSSESSESSGESESDSSSSEEGEETHD